MDDYSLKKFFTSPFPIKVLPYLLLIFAALGFLDAGYLTIQHYQHAIPPCTVGGCETVLTSSFATVAGIPLALLGVGFYLAILVLTGIFISFRHSGDEQREDSRISNNPDSGRTTFARMTVTILFTLCSLGLLVGLGLIALQAFILHAWCYYCLFSELIDFLLFDTAWWLWNNNRA